MNYEQRLAELLETERTTFLGPPSLNKTLAVSEAVLARVRLQRNAAHEIIGALAALRALVEWGPWAPGEVLGHVRCLYCGLEAAHMMDCEYAAAVRALASLDALE